MEAVAVAPALEEEMALQAETEIIAANDIANLAYRLWQERGSPVGSPEEDWYRAEEILLTGTTIGQE